MGGVRPIDDALGDPGFPGSGGPIEFAPISPSIHDEGVFVALVRIDETEMMEWPS